MPTFLQLPTIPQSVDAAFTGKQRFQQSFREIPVFIGIEGLDQVECDLPVFKLGV